MAVGRKEKKWSQKPKFPTPIPMVLHSKAALLSRTLSLQ